MNSINFLDNLRNLFNVSQWPSWLQNLVVYVAIFFFAEEAIKRISEILGLIKPFLIAIFGKKEGNKKYVQNVLNKAIKTINRKLPFKDVFNKVKLEYIRLDSDHLDFYNETPIIRIKPNEKTSKNIFNAIRVYSEQIVLKEVASKLKKVQKESTVSVISNRISKEIKNPGLTRETENVIDIMSEDDDYRRYISKLNDLCNHGLFFMVFLPEIKDTGKIVSEKRLIQNEYEKLLDFLYKIATKPKGERVKLEYSGENKVCIILIASHETYKAYGKIPYLTRIKNVIKGNANNIYLLAIGQNIGILRDIRKDVLKNEDFRLKEEFNKIVNLPKRNSDDDILQMMIVKLVNLNV